MGLWLSRPNGPKQLSFANDSAQKFIREMKRLAKDKDAIGLAKLFEEHDVSKFNMVINLFDTYENADKITETYEMCDVLWKVKDQDADKNRSIILNALARCKRTQLLYTFLDRVEGPLDTMVNTVELFQFVYENEKYRQQLDLKKHIEYLVRYCWSSKYAEVFEYIMANIDVSTITFDDNIKVDSLLDAISRIKGVDAFVNAMKTFESYHKNEKNFDILLKAAAVGNIDLVNHIIPWADDCVLTTEHIEYMMNQDMYTCQWDQWTKSMELLFAHVQKPLPRFDKHLYSKNIFMYAKPEIYKLLRKYDVIPPLMMYDVDMLMEDRMTYLFRNTYLLDEMSRVAYDAGQMDKANELYQMIQRMHRNQMLGW